MRRHLQNAVCGVLDYAAYPLGMIAVAPLLLRALGPTQFGIWAFTMAQINTGAILASGFGDANIQQIAVARSTGDSARVEHCVRTTLSIHLVLGALLALVGYITVPIMTQHIVVGDADLRICRVSLEIGSLCILLRALETVVVSTQRAFERYGDAMRISATVRVFSLMVAVILAWQGANVSTILMASALLLGISTVAQFARLASFLTIRCCLPGYERRAGRAILGFGLFTWLQAAGSAVFGQMDRLFVGMACGAVAVGAYSICMQIAQPIAGTAASAFHFVFPLLARTGADPEPRIARPIFIAFACNFLLVVATSTVLFLFGAHLLRVWTTPAVAVAGAAVLPVGIMASALAGLAITGIYAMLALGKASTVVCTTALAGAAMLASIGFLLHRYGLPGVAASRAVFAVLSLAIYIPLGRTLRNFTPTHQTIPVLEIDGIREGA
jgi:O-antigen/teichoic acid export membrane protein